MSVQYVTFYLNKQLYGMRIELVREINCKIEITPVPHSFPYIRGLMNLRGQVITVFDLKKRMNLLEESDTAESFIIILKNQNEINDEVKDSLEGIFMDSYDIVAFIADSIGEVVEVDESSLEKPPSNLGEIDARFIRSVVKLKDSLLMILQLNEILKWKK